MNLYNSVKCDECNYSHGYKKLQIFNPTASEYYRIWRPN